MVQHHRNVAIIWTLLLLLLLGTSCCHQRLNEFGVWHIVKGEKWTVSNVNGVVRAAAAAPPALLVLLLL